jgi:hypothetical protein
MGTCGPMCRKRHHFWATTISHREVMFDNGQFQDERLFFIRKNGGMRWVGGLNVTDSSSSYQYWAWTDRPTGRLDGCAGWYDANYLLTMKLYDSHRDSWRMKAFEAATG